MKIAILIPDIAGGGAEFVAAEWAEWLRRAGEEVTVLTTKRPLPAKEASRFSVKWVEGKSAFSKARNLRSYLRANRPDVIIALMPYFNLLALTASAGLGKAGPRVVISGRNVESPFRSLFGYRFIAKQIAAKLLYPRADAYIAISHPVAAEALALYRIDAAKVFVIPNPATGKYDRRSLDPQTEKSATTGGATMTGSLNILVPARLVAQKRPNIPILVAAQLADTVEHIVVHYFGAGPLAEEVQLLSARKGVNIVHHGWVEDWFTYCPPDSVVLLASLAEGFGNVLVEAAAAGIPSVVSSRCLGSSDAIVPGITGELCVGDSTEEYAEAVLRARKIQIGGDAALWTQRFSTANSGALLYRVLVSLLGPSR